MRPPQSHPEAVDASQRAEDAVLAAPPSDMGPRDGRVLALFAGVTFLGASLLFWVQPLLSKQLLPLLGGSPAVWNTCMFFFQVLLLAGYAWAHLIGRLRSTRIQVGLQLGLAVLGLVFTLRVTASPSHAPIPWLLGTLLGAVGAPYTLVVDAPEAVMATMLLHLTVLFLAARLCHGELAADRPSPERLTEFYLWLSAGGALGGLFNGVIAPVAFDSVAEYPIALLACLALAPAARSKRVLRAATVAGLVGLGAWFFLRHGLEASATFRTREWNTLVYGVPALGLAWALWARSPAILARVAGPLIVVTSLLGYGVSTDLFRERSFFGVHRVLKAPLEGSDYHMLVHGRILHGLQPAFGSRDARRRPITYYHASGPAGDAFRGLKVRTTAAHVGVVGLGAGGLVSYGRPEDRFVFYEIDPVVAQIAQNPELFTYLTEARAEVEVKLGDGRLLLQDETRMFDLLVVDAFGSDGIPMHLITLEAMRDVYLPRLRDEGAILLHVSNKFLDVGRVAAGVGLAAHLRCWVGVGPLGELSHEMNRSVWVVLKRSGAAPGERMWQSCQDDGVVWTDDWSNLFQVIRRE